MTEVVATVKAELRRIANELEVIGKRLEALATGLPPSPNEEAILEGEGEWDLRTEIRTAAASVLVENIQPAIEDLRNA